LKVNQRTAESAREAKHLQLQYMIISNAAKGRIGSSSWMTFFSVLLPQEAFENGLETIISRPTTFIGW
jgi:hypothetical protein